MLSAIVLDVLLPSKVTIGPAWVLPTVEALLLLGLVVVSPAPPVHHSPTRRKVAIGLTALVSATNMVSLVLLCVRLVAGGTHTSGRSLIGAGVVLWVTNVLLFGLWYWELDRGGPGPRAVGEHDVPDFLFPQMTDPRWAPKGWMPGLIDYLYVSFTNSTAFSPTDTMPLTPTAKSLMSAQSLVALVTIGLVVARAVNILGS
ncbi:MAG: DUF1345 domain-containing protein [Actinomycetota bacterium]|nr:DUF1345 domain-containing protein [Actinomycetota bacterium]